jgi:magnesium-transporting ATPase (P-type)
MKLPFRIVIFLIVSMATYYFVYIFVFFLPFLIFHGSQFNWIRLSTSIICAVATGSYSWKSSASSEFRNRPLLGALAKSILLGALITGAIGFVTGFFGPIIFEPEANQGPLLGIFVTGPLGTALGAAGGAIYWALKKKVKMPFDHS